LIGHIPLLLLRAFRLVEHIQTREYFIEYLFLIGLLLALPLADEVLLRSDWHMLCPFV
jgi:hypothetical protein